MIAANNYWLSSRAFKRISWFSSAKGVCLDEWSRTPPSGDLSQLHFLMKAVRFV